MSLAGPAANHLEALPVVLQPFRVERTHHDDIICCIQIHAMRQYPKGNFP